MNPKIIKMLYLLISILLGVILISASYEKIMDPEAFARNIRAYRLIPDLISPIPAIFLPWLEFFTGLSLISGIYRRASLIVTEGLFFLFSFMVGYALIMGLKIDCGCGLDLAGTEISPFKFLFNIFMMVLSIAAYQTGSVLKKYRK